MITTRMSPARSGLLMKRTARQDGSINVSQAERWASLAGGGMLACYGLSKGSGSGLVLAALGGSLMYRGLSGNCQLYQALGISTAEHNRHTSIPAGQGIKFEESVTIDRSPPELFRFWRNLENLPRVMRHLKSVENRPDGRSHWVAEGPTGDVAWDAEIIRERANEMISWRSLPGSSVDTAGSIHFRQAPGDRGTEVTVTLSYNPPAGRVGASLAWLIGQDPKRQVREDLHTFKQIMEAGTAITSHN